MRAGGLSFFVLLLTLSSGADDPWADAVVASVDTGCNPGFCSPANAVGPPTGAGADAGSTSNVHSIGTPGSYITLRFDTPVIDDPQNPQGLDFIVFGNAFYTGGNPLRRWSEPGLVEVSADVNGNGLADDAWYVMPGSRDIAQGQIPAGIPNPAPPLVGTTGVTNPNVLDGNPANDDQEYDWGYSDMTPVLAEYLDRYVRPDDPFTVGLTEGSGGGDAFDIAWAVDGAGAPANLSSINFVRVWTLVQDGGVGDPTSEIDAVADVAPDVDSDGDGILDDWEARVSNTDPMRPESTVLPLELPSDLGGSSSPDTWLGTAGDDAGNALSLYSTGTRTGTRNLSATVDLTPASASAPAPGGQRLSGAALAVACSESDFEAAQVDWAEVRLVYTTSDIAGLDELSLQPWREEGGALTQDGIRDVRLNDDDNTVTFFTRYPGIFVLVAPAGSGDLDPSPGPAVGPVSIVLQNPVPHTSKPVWIQTGVIRDAMDVVMRDGTIFTVIVSGADVVTADADPDSTGHQLATEDGVLRFAVRLSVAKDVVPISVDLYESASLLNLLGTATFLLTLSAEPLPLSWVGGAGGLLFAGLLVLARKERRR